MKRMALCLVLLAVFCCGFCLSKGYCESQRDIARLIEGLEVGEPVYYEAMTILPVYSIETRKKTTSFITLDEATRYGYLNINELEGGRVPQVKVTNDSDRYVYLMGGEILTGCKQDRLVARDVLIGPRSRDVLVTVYCVEQGRWTSNSEKFYSKGNMGVNSFRSAAQSSLSYSTADQNSIWSGISRMQRKYDVRSNTDQYQAVYEDRQIKEKVSSYECKMRNIPDLHNDTIGVVVGIGGRIVSADIFSDAHTFKKLWPKLLKSLVLEAIEYDKGGRDVDQQDTVEFLRLLHDKDYASRSGVDEGRDFSVTDSDINANALLLESTVIHIAAFPGQIRVRNYPHSGQDRRMRVMGND